MWVTSFRRIMGGVLLPVDLHVNFTNFTLVLTDRITVSNLHTVLKSARGQKTRSEEYEIHGLYSLSTVTDFPWDTIVIHCLPDIKIINPSQVILPNRKKMIHTSQCVILPKYTRSVLVCWIQKHLPLRCVLTPSPILCLHANFEVS